MDSFVKQCDMNFSPEPEESTFKTLLEQYEYVIVQSIITSFGLDFLVKDQHGGDVDTIHNVRQIGKDPEMTYKNKANEEAYKNRGKYDSDKVHKDSAYTDRNRELTAQRKAGNATNAYTGEKMERNEKSNLDHVVSGKEIHDDPGRVLAELDGVALANCESNLQLTDDSTNKQKGTKSVNDYLAKVNAQKEERKKRISELEGKSSLSDKEKNELNKLQKQEKLDQQRMKELDEKARKEYNAKLAKAYYTSPKFLKDTAKASAKVGVKMGVRQALGIVFTEVWFQLKEEFKKIRGDLNLESFFYALAEGVKRGFESAKEKYKVLLSSLGQGFVAGALSSICTTVCNIFFTTAKNVVKIIRESWSSLVQAFNVLVFNPADFSFGERMRAALKIIATGASVIAGSLVRQMMTDAVGAIPTVGSILPTFIGSFVTGVLSCTLLYFLDKSALVNKLIAQLNSVHTIEDDILYFKEQAEYFTRYAAELMKMDLEAFQKETAIFISLSKELETAENEKTITAMLKRAHEDMGQNLPWKGDFDEFMSNRENRLVFE